MQREDSFRYESSKKCCAKRPLRKESKIKLKVEEFV